MAAPESSAACARRSSVFSVSSTRGVRHQSRCDALVVSNQRRTSATAGAERSAVALSRWTLFDDLLADGGAATATAEISGFATSRSKAAADWLSPVLAITAAIDVM